MSEKIFKIQKLLKEVTLWIHPEGPVSGSLFLRPEDGNTAAEIPDDVLNQEAAFLVMKSNLDGEIRFYNRHAIVRAVYTHQSGSDMPAAQQIQCRLLMMDGSEISGNIRENLPPESARLYDYLNTSQQQFIRVFTGGDEICLVNKSYIVRVNEQ
ncbi:MAG: hypothetical protein OEZ39_13105 [Gammaproteobacteria bacterium]|nr:hypothetical protein [Gammaproteobacteria bacterium]MDH5652787.1 hypothetical protein [Gammaproteobacteria bacterium]